MKKHFTRIIFLFLILALIPFYGVKSQQVIEITGDGPDATHNMIPVCGMWFGELQKSQIIYPAAKLTALQGKKITKITLFTNQGNNNKWKNNIHIRMASTTQNDLESGWFIGSKTEVFVGKLIINSSNELNIVLSTPFFYTGDNLLIEFDLPNNINLDGEGVYFHGTTEATYFSRQVSGQIEYNGLGNAFDFLPKMRVEYADEACPPIINFSSVVNYNNTVTLNWTNPPQSLWSPEATNLTFKFFNGINQIGESNNSDLTSWTSDVLPMGSINNLSAKISYLNNNQELICESYPIKKTLTIPCLPAHNLTTTVINTNNVILTWEEPKIPTEILLSEDFTAGMPSNWTLIDVDGNGENWCIGTNGYNSANCASSYSYYPYPNNYLITPELANNATGLKYWVRKDNEIYDDKYAVMVSSTGNNVGDFTILFEEEITTTGWKPRNIDLPEGTKYIAFRHHGESVGGVHIDDIIVHSDAFIPIADPHTYTITRNDVEIASGLTETTYADTNLSGNIYDYCVEVVYQNCTSNPIYSQIFVEDVVRPPARNLSTTTNYYDVSLTWDAPLNVLLLESFESGSLPPGWQAIDHDGDGYNWHLDSYNGGYNSYNYMSSESIIKSNYNPLLPDNYLITPLVEGATSLQYWARCGWYSEHYAIMISTTDDNIASFTNMIFEESVSISETWLQRNINLPEGTKYIAFRHFNSTDKWDIHIDNIVVYSNQPITENYTYTITRNNEEIASGLTELTFTDLDGFHGTYDYCVKVVYDNATSDPICETVIIDELPCNQVKNLSSIVNDNNVKLIWDTPDDLPVLILSEDFESGIPSDWDLIDADGDGQNWYLDTYTGHNSNNCVSSESYDYNNSEALSPDNYLISPLLNNASKMEYWVFAVDNTPYEHYAVMVSTTGNSISDFTNVFEETMTNPNHWYKRSINLPPETKYIAFRHYNCTNQKGLKIDDISIYGNIIPTTAPHTYAITRNGEEIASGLTEKTYTDLDLDFNTYNYCVKAVYGYCTSEIACTNVIIEDSLCLPISDLSVIINGNDVNLTWEAPSTAETYTYTITKNEVEIASGLTETTYTDLDLDFGTYNYCVKAVAENCTPQSVCENITLEDQSICQPVFDLNATVNADNSVSLSWVIPQSTDWPSNCTEDLAFKIYNGTTQIGYSDANNLTSWTTNVLSNGTYELKVVILYYDNNSNLLCTAEASTTVNITNSFVCLPVNNLSAVVNNNNTVSLNWTNPEDYPTGCNGNLAFKFYNDNINIGSSNSNDLTSWTTPALSGGAHILTVVVHYLDNTNAEICFAETSVDIIIGDYTCPAITDLSAIVNENNTVDLSWNIPAETEWPNACTGNLAFHFYNGSTKLGESDEDNLTLWTTGILPNGTHTLKVVIYYYDNSNYPICSAEASITVIISGSFACPSVNELSAIANENNTVNLSWILPTELPTNCNGNLDFKFYDGTTQIGYDISDDLTSWTTPVLSAGTHTLAVVVYYYDDEDIEICYAEASVTVTTDIEEIKVSLFSAEIFPNPAKDLLNIKCDSEIISYELYDALGRLLINKKEVANTESIVNVSSLKHGMYMLRLNTEKGSGTFKLIIDN